MNRDAHRMLASKMRKEARENARSWPAHLVEVPRVEWPQCPGLRPIAVWRSRHYLVQVYEAPPFDGVTARRLSISRATIGRDGDWEQDIPWEELQQIKRQTGYGDWYGVEVYPRDRDVVNVANMRHLWLLGEPLPIGWFEGRAPA